MADVRLTATNPEDSSVVPVACNAKGELLLEEPTLSSDDYVAKAGDTMTGNLHLGDKITLDASDGSGTFAGAVIHGELTAGSTGGNYLSNGEFAAYGPASSAYLWRGWDASGSSNVLTSSIKVDGSATFAGDVIVGSRNKKWMIVESNGLAHLVEQTRAAGIETADLTGKAQYPPLRDIPSELTMVEEQLQKVLEKLRMVPEAGWEVWDGSD